VWDSNAKSKGQANERLKTTYGDNGHATQDPEVVFDVMVRVCTALSSLKLQVIKQSLKNANVSVNEVATLGLSTQRASFTIWDKQTGKPAIPLILWKDSRLAVGFFMLTWPGPIPNYLDSTTSSVTQEFCALLLVYFTK
jgi:putative glycerol kinase 5